MKQKMVRKPFGQLPKQNLKHVTLLIYEAGWHTRGRRCATYIAFVTSTLIFRSWMFNPLSLAGPAILRDCNIRLVWSFMWPGDLCPPATLLHQICYANPTSATENYLPLRFSFFLLVFFVSETWFKMPKNRSWFFFHVRV